MNWFLFLLLAIVLYSVLHLILNAFYAVPELLKKENGAKYACCLCGLEHQPAEIGHTCIHCQFKIESVDVLKKGW